MQAIHTALTLPLRSASNNGTADKPGLGEIDQTDDAGIRFPDALSQRLMAMRQTEQQRGRNHLTLGGEPRQRVQGIDHYR